MKALLWWDWIFDGANNQRPFNSWLERSQSVGKGWSRHIVTLYWRRDSKHRSTGWKRDKLFTSQIQAVESIKIFDSENFEKFKKKWASELFRRMRFNYVLNCWIFPNALETFWKTNDRRFWSCWHCPECRRNNQDSWILFVNEKNKTFRAWTVLKRVLISLPKTRERRQLVSILVGKSTI